MKKKLFALICLTVACFLFGAANPVWAASCGGVETSIIECTETGSGAIGRIILDVVNIMTIGVGILGVLGITIVGIQYLTAGGNEEKTRKAKRRLWEIILGLILYALIYALVQWLGVGVDENSLLANVSNNSTSGSTTSVATTPTRTNSQPAVATRSNSAVKQATTKNQNSTKTQSNAKKLTLAAESLANDIAKAKLVYRDDTVFTPNFIRTWDQAKKRGYINCFEYVSIALQRARLLKKGSTFCLGNGTIGCIRGESIKNNSKFQIITSGLNQSVGSLVKSGKLKPGDIVGKANGWHTMIYHGEKNGKYYFYSVRGKLDSRGRQVPFTRDRIVWAQSGYQSNYPIGIIVRVKN